MMTVQDVVQFLGRTNQAVSQYLREGSLHGVKSGKPYDLDAQDKCGGGSRRCRDSP